MDENQKDNFKTENCESVKITENLFDGKKICSKRCSICGSGIVKEIHDWRKSGLQYKEIIELSKKNHSVNITEPSLSRHFKSYTAMKNEMATQIIKDDTLKEITLQSVHIKKTVELLDLAYDQLLLKMQSGIYKVDISDLEKLTKMRYQILNGDNGDDKDLAAIFLKASSKYGLEVQTAMVFKN